MFAFDPKRTLSGNRGIDIQSTAGLNNIQLAFNETMSGGEGFGFSYSTAGIAAAAPLPPSDADGLRRTLLSCV